MPYQTKITDKQVAWARRTYDPHDKRRSYAAIGRHLGISRTWAVKIVKGEWRRDAK